MSNRHHCRLKAKARRRNQCRRNYISNLYDWAWKRLTARLAYGIPLPNEKPDWKIKEIT